uniref:Methyltransf_25 domain-containing protein n=1 Tax=Heterorhabditis bacteriophora TaxID=37862 RepID=A0A1I7XTS5_HETBA
MIILPFLRFLSPTRGLYREFCLYNVSRNNKGSSFSTHTSVFDRNLKSRQRDWAVKQPEFDAAQYLKKEVGWRVADKVFDLTKFNPLVLDIGCGVGHVAPHMIKENVGKIIQCDMSSGMIERAIQDGDVNTLHYCSRTSFFFFITY